MGASRECKQPCPGFFAMRALTRRLMLTTTVVGTAAGVAAAAAPLRAQSVTPSDTDWPVYGGNLGYWRYKALDQINAANFNQLEVAWQFKTDNLGTHPEFILQCTPLVIKGRLYATGGSRRDVVCLDAATGEVLWLYRTPDEGPRAQCPAPAFGAGRRLLERGRSGTHSLCHHRLSAGLAGRQDRPARSQFRQEWLGGSE